jgi:hypothetical protein
MDTQFENRLNLFLLQVELPTPDEASLMAKLLLENTAKVKELEIRLADREHFIEKELQKGLEMIKSYFLAGMQI